MPSTIEDESSNDKKYEFTNCTYSNMQIKEEQNEVPVTETVSPNNIPEPTATSSYMTWDNYLPPFKNEFIAEIRNENGDSSTTNNVVDTTSNNATKTKVPEIRDAPLKKPVIIILENTDDIEQINIVVNFRSSNELLSSAGLNAEATTVVEMVNNERQTTNTNETSTPVIKTEDVPIAEPSDTPVLIKDATGKQEITVPTLEENKTIEFKSEPCPTVTKNLKKLSKERPEIVPESTTNDALTNEPRTKRKRNPRKCTVSKTSNYETKKNEQNSKKRMRKEPGTESNKISKKKSQPKKLSNKTPNKAHRGGRSGVSNGNTKHGRTGSTKRYGIYYPKMSKETKRVVTEDEDSDSDSSMNSLLDFS